jgi:hypothetical protein
MLADTLSLTDYLDLMLHPGRLYTRHYTKHHHDVGKGSLKMLHVAVLTDDVHEARYWFDDSHSGKWIRTRHPEDAQEDSTW